MRFLKSEAGAVVAWVLVSILLAAAIVPWLYGAGKEWAEAMLAGDRDGLVRSVAESAGNAKLDRYFSRALALSVLVGLPFFWWRVKAIRRREPRPGRIAEAARRPWKIRLLEMGGAFLLAAGALWLLGMALEAAGAFVTRPAPPEIAKVVKKAVLPALGAGVIEEWLFRGLLLGVWLRVAKPLTAVAGTSFLYAFVHFMEPPADAAVADPTAALAGFQLLGRIFLNFVDPRFVAAEFAVLFTLGVILAMSRLRTGSLWFPIGLHAGLVFAFKGFNLFHKAAPESGLRPLWIGDSLRSGLLPFATLVLIGLAAHRFLSRRTERNGAE